MPSISFAELATYYLIAINFIAFAAFGIDKARAEAGQRRISESTLIGFVTLGGIIGALAGRQAFRHKTRKGSFSSKMWGAALSSVAIAGGGYLVFLTAIVPAVSRVRAMADPQERAKIDAVMASVHYAGCHQVRASGKAPLRFGEPGYREDMDGDGDGMACEDY